MLLEEFGVQAALSTICRHLSSREVRWRCHLSLDKQPPLAPALPQVIYRLAQVLARNVAQHAHAHTATLEAETLPGWVVMRLEDDGRGFDPATVAEGLGLKPCSAACWSCSPPPARHRHPRPAAPRPRTTAARRAGAGRQGRADGTQPASTRHSAGAGPALPASRGYSIKQPRPRRAGLFW